MDAHCVPFHDELQDVLTALVPRVLRQLPQVQDPLLLVEVLEDAGQRIHRRQMERGALANVYGFAWVTVRNVTLSRLQRGSETLRTVPEQEAALHLATLPARDASPEAIERRILVREAFAHLSPDERLILAWKQAGYTSAWIAERLGRTVPAVDTAHTRAKQQLRRLLDDRGVGQVKEADVEWSSTTPVDSAMGGSVGLFADDFASRPVTRDVSAVARRR